MELVFDAHAYFREETWKKRTHDMDLKGVHIDILNTMREDLRDQIKSMLDSLNTILVVGTLMLEIGFSFAYEGTFPPSEEDYRKFYKDYTWTECVLPVYSVAAALGLIFPLSSLALTFWIRFKVSNAQQEVMGSLQSLFFRKFRQDAAHNPRGPPVELADNPLQHIGEMVHLVAMGDTKFWSRRATQLGVDSDLMMADVVPTLSLYHRVFPVISLLLGLGVISALFTCTLLLTLFFDGNFVDVPWMWRTHTGLLVVAMCISIGFAMLMVERSNTRTEISKGTPLAYAAHQVKSDRETVLACVQHNGMSLEYAAEHLRNDREIVLDAVKQKGYSLQFASPGLRKDPEIVYTAVRQNVAAARYVDRAFWADPVFVHLAVQQDGSLLRHAAQTIKKNRHIVFAAMGKKPHASRIPGSSFCRRRKKQPTGSPNSSDKSHGQNLFYANSASTRSVSTYESD